VKLDFPHDWTVLAAEEFETATPRVNGDVTMEGLAQLRPSGRILDNFRLALAGSKALEFDADLFGHPGSGFQGVASEGSVLGKRRGYPRQRIFIGLDRPGGHHRHEGAGRV
jgi:hypothetical protein